jgi:large subunit ribosomal protein L19
MDILDQIETEQIKKGMPELRPGETVRVHVKVVEGEKERTQVFEGIIIRLSGKGSRTTFTVRKISYGVGVERIFPLYSPRIDRVDVVARGKVRRAKLYYLRERSGKRARLYEEEGQAT